MPLFPGIPNGFFHWFAAFGRLEARSRSKDFERGIQARTADPLWMLARQWQVGEFEGEDAGSPIDVFLRSETQRVEQVALGAEETTVDLAERPLEMVVEREAAALSWRDRVQIGQEFERLIGEAFGTEGAGAVGEVIQWYRDNRGLRRPDDEDWIDIDRTTRRFITFMESRVVDGGWLLSAWDTPPEAGAITAEMIDRLAAIRERLEDWCARANLTLASDRAEAWQGGQLDYRFGLNPPQGSADDKTHLLAEDYRNGDLDWYTLSMASAERGAWEQKEGRVTPTRITIGGLSSRWWAFEDAVTDFGNLDIAKPDLAKLALIEFALIYGDDWFSVPLPVPMSNLVRIDEMQVTDVFGVETPIAPARRAEADPLRRWEVFTLTQRDPYAPEGDALFVPAVAGFREESPPLEEVRFLRDEGANMVWGVEHQVRNGLGMPVHGFDAQLQRLQRRIEAMEQKLADIQRRLDEGVMDEDKRAEAEAAAEIRERIAYLQPAAASGADAAPRFRLSTTVPDNWIPFLPKNFSPYRGYGRPSIRLQRAEMIRNLNDDDTSTIQAMSRLLALEDDPLLWLEESAVARTGRRVQLTAQRLRWVDGKTYVWLGRKVTTGRGEGASGLKFDVVGRGE